MGEGKGKRLEQAARALRERLRRPSFLESPAVKLRDRPGEIDEVDLDTQLEMIFQAERALATARREVVGTYLKQLSHDRPSGSLKQQIRGIPREEARKVLKPALDQLRGQMIVQAIERRSLSWTRPLDPDLRYGLGMDERVVEIPLAIEAARLEEPGKILDAGAALNLPFLRRYLERSRAPIVHFTQSGDKELARFASDRISYLFGDLRRTDFRAGTFDRIVCVSTLEHVGQDNRRYGGDEEHDPKAYLDALREMLRLLSRDGRLFLSFPYGEPRELGWFRIFGAEHVACMREAAGARRVEERYVYFQSGFWAEGSAKAPEGLVWSEDAPVNGVALLLVENAG